MRRDYGTIAESLRAMAGVLDTLADAGLPDPYVAIDIQPGGRKAERDDETTIAAVDALGQVLFGIDGQTLVMSGGTHHHKIQQTYEQRDPYPGLNISVYDQVSSPEERKLREEIEALRRQRDELAATVAAGGDAA